MAAKAWKIEFPFVLDLLQPLRPQIKKFFGCTAIYVDEKIYFIFRIKDSHPEDNGIWVATTTEHHESLRKEFPMLRNIRLFGHGPTIWQNLPLDDFRFEESIERLCELALKGDKRLGKIPSTKKKSKKRYMPSSKGPGKRTKKLLGTRA